ncbi:hypothetical protein AYI81_21200 [Shewanella algae]|nr:hypothetical protein AYI80_21245 [Shewanella algae]TXS81993.1 hypothetical protein AYI81_21200 [Shewanella algae]
MRLQYQLSNGEWVDCGDRSAAFLARCIKFGGYSNEADVIAALAAGKTVRNDCDDWYSNCRDGEVAEASRAVSQAADKRPVLRCKSCGATGHSGEYPFSTLPGSGLCDDCV